MALNSKYKFNLNIIIFLIFTLFNPFFALTATAIFSIITNRINSLLIGILFTLSFSIMFANQEFSSTSDLGSYISMYIGTEDASFSQIFERFIKAPNGQEFLWFFYCKLLGQLSGYSLKVYVLTSYLLIFSLSAYLSFLVSEKGRYNFALILFSLMLFETTFLDSAYDLWRNITAILIALISIVSYFSNQSKIICRIILYSTIFIHISMILIIGLFESYVLSIYRADVYDLNKRLLAFKMALYITVTTFGLIFLSNLMTIDLNIPIFNSIKPAIIKYSGSDIIFPGLTIYIRPFFLLALAYIIYNWKKLNHFDLFLFAIFIIVEILHFTSDSLGMLFSRVTIFTKIGILFLSVKFLKNFDYKYVFVFIFSVFFLRTYIFVYNSRLPFLENIANGEFLNPIYGLIVSRAYFYNPLFYGFSS